MRGAKRSRLVEPDIMLVLQRPLQDKILTKLFQMKEAKNILSLFCPHFCPPPGEFFKDYTLGASGLFKRYG
jgi:hypothetical protein